MLDAGGEPAGLSVDITSPPRRFLRLELVLPLFSSQHCFARRRSGGETKLPRRAAATELLLQAARGTRCGTTDVEQCRLGGELRTTRWWMVVRRRRPLSSSICLGAVPCRRIGRCIKLVRASGGWIGDWIGD
jgi:hypothetical protein